MKCCKRQIDGTSRMDHVKFTAMKDGDREDYDFLTEHETAYTKGTASRLLAALEGWTKVCRDIR